MNAVRSIMRSVLCRVLCGLFLCGLALCAGCVSSQDNDIPWNAQQPWEGAPMLPGNFDQ